VRVVAGGEDRHSKVAASTTAAAFLPPSPWRGSTRRGSTTAAFPLPPRGGSGWGVHDDDGDWGQIHDGWGQIHGGGTCSGGDPRRRGAWR